MKFINAHYIDSKLPVSAQEIKPVTFGEAVAFFDRNFTIRRVNSSFYGLTGFQNFDPVNTSVSALPIWSENNRYLIRDTLCHTDAEEFSTTVNYVCSAGKRVVLQVTCIKSAEKKSGGILILRDITLPTSFGCMDNEQDLISKKRETEFKKLQEMGRQLQSFLYIASHDLKEPLRTIGNFSQLLNRQCHGYIDDKGREYLSYIMDGVRGMNSLIDDLMKYSELDSLPHHQEEIHFPTMMFILERMQKKNLDRVGGKLTVEGMTGNMTGDKGKIRLLFESLLSNSVKYKHPDRPLKINISGIEKSTHWEISFKDNGIGIKKEFFGKIFEMFKKLHSKQQYQGTGIGLAICKKIAEQHGGYIQVASEFGKFTEFTFVLQKNQANNL